MPDIVTKAKILAKDWHAGQTRKYSGLPYIVHPARVAGHVQGIGGDEAMIAAAWLHDVLEDTRCTAQEIEEECGRDVAHFVDWLTNPSKQFHGMPRESRKRMDRHHLQAAPGAVKIIKLCDRLDNLRDLGDDHEFNLLYAGESRALVRVLDCKGSGAKLASQLLVECDRLQSAAGVLANAA